MKSSRFKRRYLRAVTALLPLFSGVVWGGFWVRAAGGVDDFYTDGALLLLCGAAGTLLNLLRCISIGKLGCWFIACISCLYWNQLLPMAFFFGLSEGRSRRNGSGNFISGMISGVLLGAVFALPLELNLILIGAVLLIPCRRERLKYYPRNVRMICSWFNVSVLIASFVFAGLIYSGRLSVRPHERREIAPVTWISAAGLNSKSDPSILLISKKYPEFNTALARALAEHIDIIHPGWNSEQKYDVIVVADSSAVMRANPEKLLKSLTPDGVLVMPLELCRLLPSLPWRTVPGAGKLQFAAAVPDKNEPLEITGEFIENNLQRLIGDSEYGKVILPGMISGALVDFLSIEPELPELPGRSDGSGKMLWGAAFLLILLEIFFHNRAKREYVCLGICSAIYGLSCGILSGNNEIYQLSDSGIVFYLMAVLPLWRKIPFKGTALRVISLLAAAALIWWYLMPCLASVLTALIMAALNFAGCRSRFQIDSPAALNWQDALTFALIAGAFWLGGAMHNIVLMVIMVICTLKFWLQIRS